MLPEVIPGAVYLDAIDRHVAKMPSAVKQRIREAGLDPVPILAELIAYAHDTAAHSHQCAILRFWAQCLRREVPACGATSDGEQEPKLKGG